MAHQVSEKRRTGGPTRAAVPVSSATLFFKDRFMGFLDALVIVQEFR